MFSRVLLDVPLVLQYAFTSTQMIKHLKKDKNLAYGRKPVARFMGRFCDNMFISSHGLLDFTYTFVEMFDIVDSGIDTIIQTIQ